MNALFQLNGTAKRQILIQRLMQDFQAGERTAIKAIKEALEMNRIREAGKEGREVVYKIQVH